MAQRYFGQVAKREVPVAKVPLELPTPGERLLKIHVDPNSSLILGFNVPSIATAKDPVTANALRLISALLLDGGYSARMPTHPIRRRAGIRRFVQLQRLHPWRQPVHAFGDAQ